MQHDQNKEQTSDSKGLDKSTMNVNTYKRVVSFKQVALNAGDVNAQAKLCGVILLQPCYNIKSPQTPK